MLTINTNLSSLIAQGSMKSSTNKLNQAIERMTTGFKINHAKDNAANYQIASQMTTQINSLQVAEENTAMGLDMVTQASEILDELNNRVQRLRDLQEQANNATYGEDSLNAINKECNALVDEINRMYESAEYNGITLFMAPTTLADGRTVVAKESDAQLDTTFKDLGVVATHFEIFDSTDTLVQAYDLEENDTVNDFLTTLQGHGFTTKLKDGEITISSNTGLYVAGDLADELGISTKLQNYVASTEQSYSVNVETTSAQVSSTTVLTTTTTQTTQTNTIWTTTTTESTQTNTIFTTTISSTTQTNTVWTTTTTESTQTNTVWVTNTITTSTVVPVTSSGVRSSIYSDILYDSSGNTVTESTTMAELGMSDSDITYFVTYNASDVYYTILTINSTTSFGEIITQSASTSQGGTFSLKNGVFWGYLNQGYGFVTTEFLQEIVPVTKLDGYFILDITIEETPIETITIETTVTETVYTTTTTPTTETQTVYTTTTTHTTETETILTTTTSRTTQTTTTYVTTTSSTTQTNTVWITSTVAATGGTTFEELGVDSAFKVTVVSDGTKSALTINKTTSFDEFFAQLENKGFGVSEAGGKVELNGAGDTYLQSTFLNNLLSMSALSKTEAQKTVNTDSEHLVYNEILEDVYAPGTINLMVGTTAEPESSIRVDVSFKLTDLRSFRNIGVDGNDYLEKLDNLLTEISARQVQFGAVQNRLESVMDEISIKYDNLVSSRSTIRDADIAEVSSQYIQQQILQQASATLLATANQSPSIALQLI